MSPKQVRHPVNSVILSTNNSSDQRRLAGCETHRSTHLAPASRRVRCCRLARAFAPASRCNSTRPPQAAGSVVPPVVISNACLSISSAQTSSADCALQKPGAHSLPQTAPTLAAPALTETSPAPPATPCLSPPSAPDLPASNTPLRAHSNAAETPRSFRDES